jgi:hypothetical protein
MSPGRVTCHTFLQPTSEQVGMAAEQGPDCDLDDALRDALTHGPFALALRTAIRIRGLPLERLRSRLAHSGVRLSLSTLSNWQHGRAQPERADSLVALSLLERELRVPPGSLVSLLGPPRPRGRTAATRRMARRPERSIGLGRELAGVLASLEGGGEYAFDIVSRSDHVDVDATGRVQSVRVVTTVCAVRDGVDRYHSAFHGEPGSQPSSVTVTALRGCRVADVVRVPGAPAGVAEIVLDDVLREGESSLLEFRFDHLGDGGTLSPLYGYGAYWPTGHYELHMQFHPERLPARCWRFRNKPDAPSGAPGEQVFLSGSGRAHMHATDVNGEAVGLAWSW